MPTRTSFKGITDPRSIHRTMKPAACILNLLDVHLSSRSTLHKAIDTAHEAICPNVPIIDRWLPTQLLPWLSSSDDTASPIAEQAKTYTSDKQTRDLTQILVNTLCIEDLYFSQAPHERN